MTYRNRCAAEYLYHEQISNLDQAIAYFHEGGNMTLKVRAEKQRDAIRKEKELR
jgi:hypothetical protein